MSEESLFVRPALTIDADFTIVRNSWLRDPRIAGNPLSIYLYLLSHDADFLITASKLQHDLRLGKSAYLSARRKLEQYGFLTTSVVRYPDGTLAESGESLGGRFRRTDFVLIDPADAAASSKADNQPRTKPPVDNSKDDNQPWLTDSVDNQENPRSEPKPIIGGRVIGDGLPADGFSASLKKDQVKDQIRSDLSPSQDLQLADDRLEAMVPGLNALQLRLGLVKAGLDPQGFDLEKAALDVFAASGEKVAKPAKYLISSIVNAPERWKVGSQNARNAHDCQVDGHSWLGYAPMGSHPGGQACRFCPEIVPDPVSGVEDSVAVSEGVS